MKESKNNLLSELNEHLLNEKLNGLPEEWFVKNTVEKTENVVDRKKTEKDVVINPIPVDPSADYSKYNLVQLKEVTDNCKKCRLCETRNNVVFGVGNTNSPLIAFVGEGPGAEEDKAGEPFVGRAGKLLTASITQGIGLKREDVYICNVVKCRPPENRTPLADESSACIPYLKRQLEIIAPKVIITLGQPAQLALVGKEMPISKVRGSWYEWQGIPVRPTFHPAYLLRSPSAKKIFWEDLQEVMKKLGIERKAA